MAIALEGTPTIYESASTTSAVIPYPSGITAGELLVAVVGTSVTTAPTSVPSGWTLTKAQNGNNSVSVSMWHKVATGSESGTESFGTTSGRTTGHMFRLSGVDTTTPVDATAVGAGAPVQTTFTMPTITTATDGAMLIHGIVLNASNRTTNDIVTLSGTTLVGITADAGANGGRITGAYSETIATAGATGTRVWSKTGATALQWAGITAAFKSGASGPVAPALVQRVVGIPETNTATTARVQVKVTNATSVRLKCSTDSGGTTGVVWGSAATPSGDGNATLTVSGLTANTRYYFRVEMTDSESGTSLDTGDIGRLKTAPSGQGSFAFDFGSCTNSTDSASMAAIAARGDDLFFHLGDLFYADGTGTGVQNFRDKMNAKITATNHAAVFSTMNSSYTPSDHDGMSNNGTAGDDATAWTNWNTARGELFPMPASYYSFVWGRVRFIQIDTRSFKSPAGNTDNSSKTALGTTQKTWFKDLITSATEPVIVVIQADPWIGSAAAGEDAWAGYTTERTELANHFSSSGKNIVMLAGDMHAVAGDNGTNAPGGIAVFHASPFYQNASIKGGPYSAGPYPASGSSVVQQYGRVVVTDSGTEISLAFTGYSSDNTSRVTLTETYPLDAVLEPTGIATGAALGSPTITAPATLEPTGIATGAAFGSPTVTASTILAPTGIATGVALGSPTVTAPAALAPAGISSAEAFGSTTLTTSATLAPSGIAGAAALGSPTLTTSTTVSPGGIATGEAAGSPTLSTTATVAPSGIASSEAFGSPDLTAAGSVAPSGIATGQAFGSPTLSGSTTVEPAGLTSGAALGSPTLTMGAIVAPEGIPSAAVVPSPTLTAPATVEPAGIPTAAAVGSPSLSMGSTLAPVGIATAVAVGSPSLSMDSTLAPTGIVSIVALGSPILTTTVTVSPSSIATGAAVGSPALGFDRTVAPNAIASAQAFGTPSLDSGFVAAPVGIPGAAALGTPILSAATTISPAGITSRQAFGSPTADLFALVVPTGIPTKKFVGQPTLTTVATITPLGIASWLTFGQVEITGGGEFKTNYEVKVIKKRWKGSLG